MTTKRPAADIAARFGTEWHDIMLYVHYLHGKASIAEYDILELNNLLKSVGLPQLPRTVELRVDSRLRDDEIPEFLREVENLSAKIDIFVRDLELRFESISSALRNDSSDVPQHLLSEWFKYFQNEMSTIPSDEECQSLQEVAERQLEREHSQDSELSIVEAKLVIGEAVKHARLAALNETLVKLYSVSERFNEYRMAKKMREPNGAVDMFRQGFILLMTAFDAAIFDIVRFALQAKFYKLIGKLSKGGEKYSPADMADAGSAEKFQNIVIKDHLKKKSLRELLLILNDAWNVKCVDADSGQDFKRLMELVVRRNVHVHNRGIVDQAYLESGYNTDKFTLGDFAVIDSDYWKLAIGYTHECVRSVTIWAES